MTGDRGRETGAKTCPRSPGIISVKEVAMIEELVKGNRSYRRFHQGKPLSLETLRGLVNLAWRPPRRPT